MSSVQPQSGLDPSSADLDALKRLHAQRFTCRAYRSEAVPEPVISSILEIAKQTASWCNVQPWHVTITTHESTDAFRAALVEHATHATGANESDLPFPAEYHGVYAQRRRDAGYKLYEALGIERGDLERRASQSFENFKLFGAPHVAIVTTPADLGPYAAIDCGAFVSSFLLAACAHGVASTPQAALARYAKFIRAYFGLGDERNMVCGISFGYADLDHPVNRFRTSRARHDEVMRMV